MTTPQLRPSLRNRLLRHVLLPLAVMWLVRVSIGGVQLLALNDGQPLALGTSTEISVKQLNGSNA